MTLVRTITEKVNLLVLLVRQQNSRDVHLGVRRVPSQVPRENAHLDFLVHFVLGLELSHFLLEDALDSIGSLAHVLVEENFDRIELLVVVEVILDVPLDSRDHLLELASNALVSLLDDPSNVAICACVLL